MIEKGQNSPGIYLILRGNLSIHYISKTKSQILQLGRHTHFGEFSLIGLPSYFDFQARTPLICLRLSADAELKQKIEIKLNIIKKNILERLETLLLLKYQAKAQARGAQFDWKSSNPKLLQTFTKSANNQELDTSFDDVGPLFFGENIGKKIRNIDMIPGSHDSIFGASLSKMELLADRNMLESENFPEYHIPSEPHDLSMNMANYSPKKEVRLSPARRFGDYMPTQELNAANGKLLGRTVALEKDHNLFTEPNERLGEQTKPANLLELINYPEAQNSNKDGSQNSPQALEIAGLGDLAAGIDKTKNLVTSQLPDESFEVFRLEHFGVDDESQPQSSDFKLNSISEGVDSGFLNLLSKKRKHSEIGTSLLGIATKKPTLPPITNEVRDNLEYPEHKRDFEFDDHNLIHKLRVSAGILDNPNALQIVSALEVSFGINSDETRSLKTRSKRWSVCLF